MRPAGTHDLEGCTPPRLGPFRDRHAPAPTADRVASALDRHRATLRAMMPFTYKATRGRLEWLSGEHPIPGAGDDAGFAAGPDGVDRQHGGEDHAEPKQLRGTDRHMPGRGDQ
jgi:hypothetical protein